MQDAVYAQIDTSQLKGNATVESYKCREDLKRCDTKLILTDKASTSMTAITDYISGLKEQPSIMKSGQKRNVFVRSIKSGESGYEVSLSIGDVKP